MSPASHIKRGVRRGRWTRGRWTEEQRLTLCQARVSGTTWQEIRNVSHFINFLYFLFFPLKNLTDLHYQRISFHIALKVPSVKSIV